MGSASGGILAYERDRGQDNGSERSGFSILDLLKPKQVSHGADWLLLTCMDYRLTGHTARYMTRRRLSGKFDHIVLAGASLGATCTDVPEWNATFWAHLNTAISLHQIKTLILMDHTDCGAYKLFLKDKYPAKRKDQIPCHVHSLNGLEEEVRKRFPDLSVEKHIMHVNGKVLDV